MSPILLGALTGGGIVLVFALFRPKPTCPDCGTVLPSFRRPANAEQAVHGGWTCPKCGIEIDRNGNKRSAS